jgi:hypothetical protein
VQLTEAFEYVQALGNSQFSIPFLQPFRLVYAAWLADVGMRAEALEYVLYHEWMASGNGFSV